MDENWRNGVRDYWRIETQQGRRLWMFYTRKPRVVRTWGICVIYSELCTTSNFTFLRGASHPEELVTRAADLGLSAIAITDHNSLAGVVRAYAALKELRRSMDEITIRSTKRVDPSSREEIQGQDITLHGDHLPKLIIGARLILEDSDVDWVALPRDRKAYEALSRLLTLGKRRSEKDLVSFITRMF